MTIQIKHLESNTVVTPMPSAQGRFGDETLPNCSATHCCLVMAARTTALRGLVSQPSLTEAECMASMESIIADKALWTDAELAQAEVTAKDVEAKRDEIRGYSEERLQEYILAKTEYEKDLDADGNKVIKFQFTEEEAREILHRKEMTIGYADPVAVEVPDNDTLELELIEEREKIVAKQKCDQLINQGFLVTDLDAKDEDGYEIYEDWKAQFEVIVLED